MTDRILQRRRGPLGTAAAILLLAPTLTAASPPARVEVRSAPLEPSKAVELRVSDGAVHLSLEEVVALALERNLNLRVERYGREQSRLGIQQAMGIYDLGLIGSASISERESPSASNLDGAAVSKQESQGLSLGISQLLPSGGTGNASWDNSKLETNSQFSSINPSYSSGLNLRFVQPLLRDFGRDSTEFGIRVAELSSGAAREVFVGQVVATIANAENFYWNLVAARYGLRVAEESLALARKLHENNQVRVDVGTLAPLELVGSETGIAIRDEEIIRARAAIGDAEDALRYLIRLDDARLWSMPVIPDTEAAMAPITVSVEEALRTAVSSRSELAQRKIGLQSREIEAAYYQSQTRPRLDLTATYGWSGVGGDAVVRDNDGEVIASIPGGWDDALQQITDLDFPGWSVGVEFGYPLQNRAARARATSAELALEQERVAYLQTEELVEAEVRRAVRGLETSQQQIESARVSVNLAERNLDAERRRYENGLSTSFQILQVEEVLTGARSREVEAITGYRRALVEYHRAIGQLLESSGVAIVD